MLRRMDMKVVALALVGLLLTACGSEDAPATQQGDGHKDRLLALADEAARGNGGEAKVVEAVKTTRRAVERMEGSSSNQPDVPVWVVQVSGSDYTCGACSIPVGAKAPIGSYLTLVPTVGAYETTSFGIHASRQDLASLGEVEVLRDQK